MRILAEVHSPNLQIRDFYITKAMNDSLNAVSLEFQSEVKISITQKKLIDTGRLRSSVIADINGMMGRVGTHLIYARIHEYGGIIRPKRGKYLVFPVKVGGKRGGKGSKKMVFAKQVTIKEKRYFRDAIDTFNPKMKRILENVMSNAAMQMRGDPM